MIVAQGGVTGGQSLYAKGGKPKYCYNFFGLERYYVEGTEAIPAGDHQVRMEFTYDGGGVGKGGTVTLYIDGDAVGDGPHRADRGVPVLRRRDVRRRRRVRLAGDAPTTRVKQFTGEVNWVEIDLGLDDHNHLIKPEDRLHLAMGIQ